jgi:ABC-type nitrate/sulfonate/bicarbonate transport system substrate-binding protein
MTNTLSRRGALRGGIALSAALAAPAMLSPRAARAATPLTFQLDWKYNAQFAGLFVAEAAGLYADAGVAVTIREWNDSIRVMDAVGSGEMDMACAEQSLIIAAQAAGAPVKAVATMFQASPYGLMTLPDKPLEKLEDLRGKKIGVHDDGAKVMALVRSVNGFSPQDIELVEISYKDKFDKVTSGELHAVQCYVIDEPIGVAAKYGLTPKVMHMRDHGFTSTAQTIAVNNAALAAKREAVRAFLRATFEGWKRTLADKETAAKTVVERFVPEGSPYKDVAYQIETLRLLEPYVTEGAPGGRIGAIDPAAWAATAQMMKTFGIVDALPDLHGSVAADVFG